MRDLIRVVENKLNILREGRNKIGTEIVVESWIYGTLESKEYYKERKRFFGTLKCISNLTGDVRVKKLMQKYLKDTWKRTDRVLNNYIYGNGCRYLVDNYSIHYYKENKQKLIETVRDIISIFISIFSIV